MKHQGDVDRRITHLLFVHGFDIPLPAVDLYANVADHLRQLAAVLGMELILCSTNLRTLTDRALDWGLHAHGAALASVAICLSQGLRVAFIPASHTYADGFPWGSHPTLDPLWSTQTMEIVHDGCEANRVQKVQRQIAHSSVALDHLRVCWQNRRSLYNCGECEKCIRTMINLRVCDVLERCRTFPSTLDLNLVKNVVIRDDSTRAFVRENLTALRDSTT